MYIIAVLIAGVVAFFAYQYWKYRASDDGAPYVAMEPEVVDHILHLANLDENDILYDLGSGDGRIPIMAGLRYNIKAVGVEIDKLRYLYSVYQSFVTGLRKKVHFLNTNLFNVDLSEASVVIVYLEQYTNDALKEKFLKELKPGTLVISASFNFPAWKPIFVDNDPIYTTPWGPTSFYEIGRSTDHVTKQKTLEQNVATSVTPTPTPTPTPTKP